MRALAAAGRQTEALRSYQAYRSFLVERAGTEPSDELRRVEQTHRGRMGRFRAETALIPRVRCGAIGRRRECRPRSCRRSRSSAGDGSWRRSSTPRWTRSRTARASCSCPVRPGSARPRSSRRSSQPTPGGPDGPCSTTGAPSSSSSRSSRSEGCSGRSSTRCPRMRSPPTQLGAVATSPGSCLSCGPACPNPTRTAVDDPGTARPLAVPSSRRRRAPVG